MRAEPAVRRLLTVLLVASAAPAVAAEPPAGSEDPTEFWAFQPPADPPVPPVGETSWPQSLLDHFILARLEDKGLRPAPPADKRTLIRRATFDLTGLPPTPDEIDSFLADDSPQAFPRVVERLLDSPAYGERWGRHWLDVVRYADSNGLDENAAHAHAWRYRDYVVAAFNSDKPYDQFVIEQLAGDLLPADDPAVRNGHLTATGFLSLGPKVLAEVDKLKMEMDIIDEQIDTTGRAFLGLTLGCARCHDHKFDPLPTTDYYALAGIFKSTRTMETFKTIARWFENEVPTPADQQKKEAWQRQVDEKKAAVDALVQAANAELQAKLEPGAELPEKPETQYPPDTQAELKRLRGELAAVEKNAPVIPAAMGVTEGAVTDLPVHIRGNHLSLAKHAVPRRFPIVLAGEEQAPLSDQASGRLELARWMTAEDHPLTSRVMVNRIWHWHFGQGLVRTPDNFGALGERPTHPELLDWLARRFVQSGWSVKAMHRLIMLSSTYQMSSAHDHRAARLDPENRLWWRANVRRLEAEEIRDALLAVSGRLDRTMGGSLLNTENYKLIFDHTSKDPTNYDSNRRSLYLPIVRNNLYPVFQLFDYADASTVTGNRPTSTVAPQALFMMNGDLVMDACDAVAADLLARTDLDQPERIRLLYRQALGRPAAAGEIANGESYLDLFDELLQSTESDAARRRLLAWSSLCQVILASNEFISIR